MHFSLYNRRQEYTNLYKILPSLKRIIEKRKLYRNEKHCLNFIYKHYKEGDSNNKKKLRKVLKDKRTKMPLKVLKKKSLLLNKKIVSSQEYKSAKTVFCYISFNNEIDTFYILRDCLNSNKTLCAPVIYDGKMTPGKIIDIDNLKKNKYGILEPQKIIEINKNDIDLAIVPALAFNALGYRLGYGGGYYDIFLNNYNGMSIGIVLKKFVLAKFVPDEFDLPVKKLFIQ